jgi:hypothetical protein
MIGAYVMTQANCQGRATADDPIGLAAYGMDSHNVQRYLDAQGHVRNEGDVQVGGFSPYPISYRSITPKAAECGNLLVPVCLSATHISYGSIRMEPVFMVLGQCAATAACLAIDAGTAAQKVDYLKLRERLAADKQVLEWKGPKRAAGIDAAKLPGIVVDDARATFTGDWTHSSAAGPFVGEGYRHDGNANKGSSSATFEAKLPAAGRYEVRVSYSPNPNRATNVAVTVRHAHGQTIVKVNQRTAGEIQGTWHSLGTFNFAANTPAAVIISNAETDGYVIVDAVQWIEAK